MDDLLSGLNIPNASVSEELLQQLEEIQCSVVTEQHLASWPESRKSSAASDEECLCFNEETENDKISDRLEKITLAVTALQIENIQLWSRLEELHVEVNTLRNQNNTVRDEFKSQWEALHDVRCKHITNLMLQTH